MMADVDALKSRYYDDRPGWIDGTAHYLQLLESYVAPDMVALDIGAGDGSHFVHPLRGRVREVVGLDADESVRFNRGVDRGIRASAEAIPMPDDSCDLVVSSFTLEHLEAPDVVVREIARVLRPDGAFVFRTPNLWHYVTLAARLSPHSFHRHIANRARARAGGADPFPTYYRCNTRRRIRHVCASHGLRERTLHTIEPEPSYLQFSALAFRLGVAYERMVNASELFASLRVTILGAFVR